MVELLGLKLELSMKDIQVQVLVNGVRLVAVFSGVCALFFHVDGCCGLQGRLCWLFWMKWINLILRIKKFYILFLSGQVYRTADFYS